MGMTAKNAAVWRSARLAPVLLAAAFLAACAPAKEEFGQCAPGVDELGRATTVLPPGC